MNTATKPMSEINRKATHILFKEMGVVETIRFFNQFSVGYGDYTKDREELFANTTIDQIINEIRKDKKSAG